MTYKKKAHNSPKLDYETPWELFNPIDEVFAFTLDVCASEENTKCKYYYDVEVNGLSCSWKDERCWLNPPYTAKGIGQWLEKAIYESSENNAETIALLPDNLDRVWFHKYVMNYLLPFTPFKGRKPFIDPDTGKLATNPANGSILVYIGKELEVTSLALMFEFPWCQSTGELI